MTSTQALAVGRSVHPGFILCLVLLASCREHRTAAKPAAQPASPSLTLEQTFHRVQKLAANHSYLALRSCVHPDVADRVLDILLAMDELRAANDAARESMARACPGLPLEAYDAVSLLESRLGLLAGRLQPVDTPTEEGDDGFVRVRTSVAGEQILRFARLNGRWVYVPEAWPVQSTELIREAAGALNRMALVLGEKQSTPTEIKEEFCARMTARLRRIDEATRPTTRPA